MATTVSDKDQALLSEVVSSGCYRSEEEALSEAIRLLREQTANGAIDHPHFDSREEWIGRFRDWTRRPRSGNPQMDDSRESIYGDRGA